MSKQSGILSGIAGRYAAALFELVEELGEKDGAQITADMTSLAQLLGASDDLVKLVRSPVISAAEQEAAMHAVLDKLGAATLSKNFIGLVIRKRRAFFIGEIIRQFSALVADARNEMVAAVASSSIPASRAITGSISSVCSPEFHMAFMSAVTDRKAASSSGSSSAKEAGTEVTSKT